MTKSIQTISFPFLSLIHIHTFSLSLSSSTLPHFLQIMASIPDKEAARYGDSTFGHIMMAKVICVHLAVELAVAQALRGWLRTGNHSSYDAGAATSPGGLSTSTATPYLWHSASYGIHRVTAFTELRHSLSYNTKIRQSPS